MTTYTIPKVEGNYEITNAQGDEVYVASTKRDADDWVAINTHNDLCDMVKAPQHLYASTTANIDQLAADLLAWYQTPRAVYSTDKGHHFVLVDGKDLHEFDNEYDAISYATDINETRKIALRPTLAAICQQIFDAGFDCRNHLAAMGTLSQRDYDYWEEFIPSATPGDWLIWAAEDVSRNLETEMMEYYSDAITALRKI